MTKISFFPITANGGGGGSVNSVTATPPLTSTEGSNPDISTSMNTNKLIGRSSAGVGVMEEIAVGDGLDLVGNILSNTATPTPLGYYGAFHDDSIQNALANDTGYAMIYGQTDLSNGISIVSNGTNLTRITFAHTGVYDLQFSSQFENKDNVQHYVTIWLRKNGNDVPETSSIFTLNPRKNSSTYGQLVASWNFVFEAISGDYFEIVWSTNDYTQVNMPTLPATAYSPLVPSVILTVTQQSGIMAGSGITALNGLTAESQTFEEGTGGTDFNIVSSGSTHTFNIPSASNLARGLVSIIAQTFAGIKTFLSAPIFDSLTASQILATDGSKAVQSLDTATYPSLIELSYVKGVTSSIQTQLNSKATNGSGTSFLSGYIGTGVIGAGLTNYSGVIGGGYVNAANEFQRLVPLPQACSLSTWYVRTSATQPASGSLVITLRQNQVDTALVITIAAGSVAGTYSNTGTSISFSAGDLTSVKIVNNASANSTPIISVSIMVTI
jgi:hypothetical protein